MLLWPWTSSCFSSVGSTTAARYGRPAWRTLWEYRCVGHPLLVLVHVQADLSL